MGGCLHLFCLIDLTRSKHATEATFVKQTDNVQQQQTEGRARSPTLTIDPLPPPMNQTVNRLLTQHGIRSCGCIEKPSAQLLTKRNAGPLKALPSTPYRLSPKMPWLKLNNNPRLRKSTAFSSHGFCLHFTLFGKTHTP
jgi:hypothetical protein